ncbi:MAG: N-6 DNA methylase [Sphingobacteriales bacterium]|nr:N-6 DNA methylase [Sphingobacteriales bacterium]
MTDFEKYFKSLQSHKIDDITEHSHRPALKELMESLAGAKVKILHEPKREGKFGSPDFKITHTESIIGYVENKKIEENLDKTIKSDQIKKYQSLSDNILLTNYIDWIWMKEGKIQQRETLCFLTDIENKRAKLDKTKVDAVEKLIKSFLSQAPKQIGDAKKLAEALAVRAKLLKDFLLDELKRQEVEHTEGRLYQLYETFKTFVFHELTVDEFSDAFAQNLVYGLFLAKLNADVHAVNLYNAKKYIPASFELIRELVNFLDELDNEEYRETRWIVEEVLTIMNNLDLRAIQDTLSFTKKRKDADNIIIKDPYVYFYEDFLAAYDKKLRKAKGVYYTPPPVVNFIVRAIDDILIKTFKIKEGLADRNKVTVLDFATGTGTFLLETLQQIFDKLPRDSGKKDLIIKEHVLKNLFGFEYLIAPYTIAHLKLSHFLKDNDYQLKDKETLQICLSNTLEPIPSQIKIPLFPALTEESKQAQEIKDKPILVITGNPPYSGHSKNNGKWITNKIQDYYFVDDKPLGEKNPKWLQDDYVKFIRFAQDKMETVEEGVVGIITNHRFLTNPTFRGMRQSLMKTFDQLYFIDLHGSNKPKEFAPDGSKDENVFDIEQGVAISLFIKKKGLEKKIFHTDFWGTRIDKYKRSLEDEIKAIKWNTIEASAPFYLFQPQDEELKKKYNLCISIKDIFIKNSNGVVTKRDNLVIGYNNEEIKAKLKVFNDIKKSDEDIAEYFKIPLQDKDKWNLSAARKYLTKTGISNNKLTKIYYRPFDTRVIYFDEVLVARLVKNVMASLRGNNKAIICGRAGLNVNGDDWNLITVTNSPTDLNLFSRGGATIFPIYISPSNQVDDSLLLIPNFKPEFLKLLKFKQSFEELTGYIYSILHSPTYRKKYAEFLKIDFPRIPFTDDKKIFKQLSELGNQLIKIHLLEDETNYSYGDFIGKGTNIVEKSNYVVDKKVGKLYINKTQYFNNVPQEIYNFYIGGYQVLDKYLKDRKGRELNIEEVDNVRDTARALAFTTEQMKKIDSLTKSWI